jgi:uncharacterized membrane protein YphA (DoxX/SURF4 family)
MQLTEKRISHGARILFAVAMIGLGVVGLLFKDFALGWQPVSPGIALRSWLAVASGMFLVISGSALLLSPKAIWASLLLAGYWGAWTLIRIMEALPHLDHAGTWLGVSENLTITGGAVLITNHLAIRTRSVWLAEKWGEPWVRRTFALSCVVFGWCHFVYADITAKMIPAWLPFNLPLTWLTGLAHIAAGLGLLLMVLPKLAAFLEAIMMSIIVLLVHVPSLGATPAPFWAHSFEAEWFVGLAALAIAASGWAVAGSLTIRPIEQNAEGDRDARAEERLPYD